MLERNQMMVNRILILITCIMMSALNQNLILNLNLMMKLCQMMKLKMKMQLTIIKNIAFLGLIMPAGISLIAVRGFNASNFLSI